MSGKTVSRVLLATTLTQLVLGAWIEDSFIPETVARNDWPCPDENDILPCVCGKRIDETLHLDCSKVPDDITLERIFKSHFPRPKFTSLTIMSKAGDPRINIFNLNENVFQNVTFDNIRISNTHLNWIYPTVFDKSLPFLEILIITDNKLRFFPFEVVDNSPNLKDLRLFRNNIVHMSDLRSDSLEYLHISYNPGLQYGDHAFDELTNLKYLVANDIHLRHVAPNAIKNTNLKYLDMSHNILETLYSNSLAFGSSIKEIKLNTNIIHTVEVGAISGLQPNVFLWMQHNYVTSLDEDVWEPVFSSVAASQENLFVFDDNPFECQCNILWLVTDDAHRDTIARGTYCLDTDTDLLDVDVAFLIESCKTPSPLLFTTSYDV